MEINEMSNDDLLKCLSEIKEWKNTGILKQDGKMKEIFKNGYTYSLNSLENDILDLAIERFKDVVSLLMTTRIYKLLK